MHLSLPTLLFASFASVNGFQNPSTFVRNNVSFQSPLEKYQEQKSSSALNFFSFGQKEEEPAPIVEEEDEGFFAWTDFGETTESLVYGGAWAGLLVFAAFLSPGELNSSGDTALIESFIANPTAPDMNPFFFIVFNLLGLPAAAYACTANPRASLKGGYPAAPPMLGSLALGYFSMGTYLALRKTPETEIIDPSTQLGWFTRNVLENKIFNVAILGLGAFSVFTGANLALVDPVANWNGFIDLLSSSKLAAVSSADLLVLTMFLTKEVADDYRVRCEPENVGRANLIGASTALLPMIGALMYCVARPSFTYEDE